MCLKPRSWRNIGLTAAAVALWASAASALPKNYQLGFQPAASPVMDQIENFHTELLYIITAVCLFVLAVLVAHNLVRRDDVAGGESRFSMFETIREFAWERLALAQQVR